MAITLTSDVLEVLITPERGADVVQVVDRASGVATLAQSATGDVRSGLFPTNDSMVHWIHGYPGGWQLLAPNAGPPRVQEGVTQGFHGEAALAHWAVLAQTEASLTLETSLLTAPLHLKRVVTLDGAELRVSDTVTNRSPDPSSTRLVQHPAFGAPFLDEHSYLITDAGTLISDADAPGSLVQPNAVGSPLSLLASGPTPASIALPAPGSRESLFAALTDFRGPTSGTGADGEAAVTFVSPTHGFGMRLTWDRSVYPAAWFWIEANAGAGWPWYRRLYAIAVEPANVLPGEGTAPNGRERGGMGLVLAPGQALTSTIRLARVPLAGE